MATDLHHLGERVQQRRVALGLGIEPAARKAGMSKDTWKRVERGQSVLATTYPKIDFGLDWATGSCEAILEGQEPIEIERSTENGGVIFAKIPSADLADAVEQAVQSAAIATTDNLTAAQIRELSARVLEDLKKRGLI